MQQETAQKFTRHEIRAMFIEILNTHQQEGFTDITEETVVCEKYPEMDDLDRVEIIMDTEILFNIVIEDDEVYGDVFNEEKSAYELKLKTIKEWVDFIEKKINELKSVKKD